ncbi:DUF4360 domain-containing protein [Streptomyces sp. BA2]|uniref:DUF4360 domain-containing protein n=1 Tax=Streptomyces sp. BA2 TaxID=436595 RepID=UPI0013228FF6|nr:DUF4360 domain-containing protein [Streptomyces sp. BA2]
MRKSALTVGCAAVAMTASTITGSVAAQEGAVAPPDKIVIELATVNGSGCPLGTTAVAVSPDNTAFTVTYSDYLAQVGPGTRPTDFRKNCQLNLRVHVPQGITYAIARADYRGFMNLEKGATAQQKASYYFQGMPQTAAATHGFAGPRADNWQVSDVTDIDALVWAPCGEERNFNINTELRVNTGTSDRTKTSFITMDSTDASIGTVYHLAWKTCP